jgi:chemotaxis protein CheX
MDVRYINPFIQAVQHVFKTMLDAEIFVSKPSLKDSNVPHADVSAIIGYTGNATGSVSLCFSKQSATKVASKFADMELTFEDSVELGDALGELANMVAGQAKAKLPADSVSISLPRVVMGHDLVVVTSRRAPVVQLQCDSNVGRFTVEVMMEMKKTSPEEVAETASA